MAEFGQAKFGQAKWQNLARQIWPGEFEVLYAHEIDGAWQAAPTAAWRGAAAGSRTGARGPKALLAQRSTVGATPSDHQNYTELL